jgi:hypothetical protein
MVHSDRMKHAYLNPPYAFGEERPWTSKVTTSPLRSGWNGAEWQNCKTRVISTVVIVGDNCSDRLVNTNTLDDLLIDVIMVGPVWNCPPTHKVGWVSSNPLRGITSEMSSRNLANRSSRLLLLHHWCQNIWVNHQPGAFLYQEVYPKMFRCRE